MENVDILTVCHFKKIMKLTKCGITKSVPLRRAYPQAPFWPLWHHWVSLPGFRHEDGQNSGIYQFYQKLNTGNWPFWLISLKSLFFRCFRNRSQSSQTCQKCQKCDEFCWFSWIFVKFHEFSWFLTILTILTRVSWFHHSGVRVTRGHPFGSGSHCTDTRGHPFGSGSHCNRHHETDTEGGHSTSTLPRRPRTHYPRIPPTTCPVHPSSPLSPPWCLQWPRVASFGLHCHPRSSFLWQPVFSQNRENEQFRGS